MKEQRFGSLNDNRAISPEHVQKTCLGSYGGASACKHLGREGIRGRGFCTKGSGKPPAQTAGLIAGNGLGDNCSGSPDFIPQVNQAPPLACEQATM